VAGFTFQLGSGKPGSKTGSLASRVGLFLFATPFAGFGVFAIWGGIQKLQTGSKQGIFICLFGLVFAALGFGLMYAAITAARRQAAAGEKYRAQTDGGTKPWLARADWAAGRIKSTNNSQTVVLAILAVAFCGMGGLFTFLMLPEELRKGNYKALLVLIFPLAGIGLLAALIRALLARRRYGDCFFEMAAIPGALGGSLTGLIQTGARIQLEHGLTLKLSCVRRVATGSGEDRSTQESILWQDEKVLNPPGGLPEPEPSRSGIPVYFKIPADQPECFSQGNETILWRLEAAAKVAGPDFNAAFDVPVYQIAGAAVAADEADPTAELQMSVEEIRRDENSRIEITDGPNGREFYFPAARNPGVAFSVTVAFLAFGGFTVAARLLFHSVFFEIVFGLVSLLIFIGCVNLWFKSSQVIINSSGVTARNRWLLFSRTRRFDTSEIARFDSRIGMTSGNHAYHAIKLVARGSEDNFATRKARYQQTGERPPITIGISDPNGTTLAGGIASKPEVDWLVREMTRALGRKI